MKEIGSEFWKRELCDTTNGYFDNDIVLLMSGRTALDFILKDIKKSRQAKKAYLPSYCCSSMIVPFEDNDIEVEFYSVIIDEKKGFICDIDMQKDCDIVFLIDYFGFINPETEIYVEKFRAAGKVVVKDMTHSVFSENYKDSAAHYTFASLRKWTALSSGACVYKNGEFFENVPKSTNIEYIAKRKDAAREKLLYMEKSGGNKDNFLKEFSFAEEILDKDYKGYSAEPEIKEILSRLDINYISEKRRQNSQYLLRELKNSRVVFPLYRTVSEREVPLFVPIRVKYGLREQLRKYLIGKRIYLPIHWPLSLLHKISRQAEETYADILSVVCDQRYDIEDMKRMLKTIEEFEVRQCL